MCIWDSTNSYVVRSSYDSFATVLKFIVQLMDQTVEDYADNPPGLVHTYYLEIEQNSF